MKTTWIQNDLLVEGVRLHYYRTNAGNTGKQAMMLVHGFSDNGLCWQPAAEALEDRYDIVMPDCRGHGQSARVEPGESLDMTADLAGLVGALGLQRPILGGHSMGAMLASNLAARHPDLPKALILEDPPWFAPAPGQEAPSVLADESPVANWIKSLADLTLEEVVAQNKAEHPAWSDVILRRWSEGKKQLDWNFFSARDRMWEVPWRKVVAAITCPTLLVTADPEMGGLITPEIAREVVEMNPRFRVAHIAGAGHHVRFEKPAPYMQAVVSFLGGLE